MKQLLLMGVTLTLLGGCTQSTPSSDSVESLPPANTETVVLKVPGMT
jgi:hypothetical protein